jgi:hypothetical protein
MLTARRSTRMPRRRDPPRAIRPSPDRHPHETAGPVRRHPPEMADREPARRDADDDLATRGPAVRPEALAAARGSAPLEGLDWLGRDPDGHLGFLARLLLGVADLAVIRLAGVRVTIEAATLPTAATSSQRRSTVPGSIRWWRAACRAAAVVHRVRAIDLPEPVAASAPAPIGGILPVWRAVPMPTSTSGRASRGRSWLSFVIHRGATAGEPIACTGSAPVSVCWLCVWERCPSSASPGRQRRPLRGKRVASGSCRRSRPRTRRGWPPMPPTEATRDEPPGATGDGPPGHKPSATVPTLSADRRPARPSPPLAVAAGSSDAARASRSGPGSARRRPSR